MRKIENFAQISDLLNAQLKKGVITNNFLRGEDYTREIENGLYIHEADGAPHQFSAPFIVLTIYTCYAFFRQHQKQQRRCRFLQSTSS